MAADDGDKAVLLAAYRAALVPATARRERVLARVLDPQTEAVFLPRLQPAARPAVRAALPVRVLVLAIAAGVLAAIGIGLVGGGIATRSERPAKSEAVDHAAPLHAPAEAVGRASVPFARPPTPPAAAARAAAPEQEPVPDRALVPVQHASARATPRRKEPAVADAPVPDAPTPVSEAALVREALAALDRRDWDAAATSLARHASEFPRGALAKEREALEIVVQCRRAPSEAARIRARDFIVHTALSPHQPRILAACRASAGVAEPFGE